MTARRIVVDMTPLGPGGQNGGAGPVATSLVRHVAAVRPDWELVLLTSGASHAEVAALEAANVRRVQVEGVASDRSATTAARAGGDIRVGQARAVLTTDGLRGWGRRGLNLAPVRLRVSTKHAIWRLRHARHNARLVEGLHADLVFGPFGVAYYRSPHVKLVAIVHDLQHVAYPGFFSAEQRLNRERQLRDVCRTAQRVVCVSEYVRQTLVRHLGRCAERALAIPHGLLQEPAAEERPSGILERFGLTTQTYLLYPANFWPHKNHPRLFEALRASRMRLVCTGAPSHAMDALRLQAARMLGPERVVFAGYVDRAEFQELLENCRALIYPSLYEGFGLPVLEAMAAGKPVLCSSVASLPEVGGDAAEYFDPNDTSDIARAVASLDDRQQVARRIELGRARARVFGNATDMACRYLAVFEEVLGDR